MCEEISREHQAGESALLDHRQGAGEGGADQTGAEAGGEHPERR